MGREEQAGVLGARLHSVCGPPRACGGADSRCQEVAPCARRSALGPAADTKEGSWQTGQDAATKGRLEKSLRWGQCRSETTRASALLTQGGFVGTGASPTLTVAEHPSPLPFNDFFLITHVCTHVRATPNGSTQPGRARTQTAAAASRYGHGRGEARPGSPARPRPVLPQGAPRSPGPHGSRPPQARAPTDLARPAAAGPGGGSGEAAAERAPEPPRRFWASVASRPRGSGRPRRIKTAAEAPAPECGPGERAGRTGPRPRGQDAGAGAVTPL